MNITINTIAWPTRIALVAALAAAFASVTGCGSGYVRGRVERAVERKLPEAIGPAAAYTVTTVGSTSRMMKGKIDRLDITGRDVQLSGGITLSQLEVRIDDLEFDASNNAIKRAGETHYTAVLGEQEINRWAAEHYSDVPDLKIVLADGLAQVSARPGISKARVTVEADARPVIRDQRTLALELADVRAVGVSAPNFAREYLETRLPAIFDVRDMGFDAKVSSVKIAPGMLTLEGTLNLVAALE